METPRRLWKWCALLSLICCFFQILFQKRSWKFFFSFNSHCLCTFISRLTVLMVYSVIIIYVLSVFVPGDVYILYRFCFHLCLYASILLLPLSSLLLWFVQRIPWQQWHWWAQHQPPAVCVYINICARVFVVVLCGCFTFASSWVCCVCHVPVDSALMNPMADQLNWVLLLIVSNTKPNNGHFSIS